jgi:hypothetical protein
MLRALDGEEGRMSRRYIQRQREPVLSFAKDFDEYVPHFFNFYNAILCIIENDPELKEEHEKILKEKELSRENYEKKIKQEYLNSIRQYNILQLPSHKDNNGTIPNQKEKCSTHASKEVSDKAVRILHNGVVEVGLERIRAHHSNPNYKKEMEEFEKLSKWDKERLRGKKQPRKKTTCVFNPFLLPIDVREREKLHEQGKVLPW